MNLPRLRQVHGVVYGIMTVVPKTTETIALLDRIMFNDAEVQRADDRKFEWPGMAGNREMEAQFEAGRRAAAAFDQAVRRRSLGWVIGSSLGFEAVVLGLAAWVFCRRDY